MKNGLLSLVPALIPTQSCAVVQKYEMVNLNRPAMNLSDLTCDRNLLTMHSYR